MSSFKKAIPKRQYKERSQLSSRKHLGQLEKKKDYKLRAQDTHKKEKQLSTLREQALTKNPDEFYFAMENTRLVSGKHTRLSKDPDPSTQKRQKIIDGNLLTMKMQSKLNKMNQLKGQLHLIDAEPSNSHTIFVKSIDKLDNFDLAQHFNTDPELVGTGNMLSKEQIENFDVSDLEFKVPAGYQEFESFKKDEKVLRKSLDKNLMDKKMMGKKEKFKVIDEDKKVVKWFRERKR